MLETALMWGLRLNGKCVRPGARHSGVRCGSCLHLCRSHPNYDLCFKCSWHRERTHCPTGHEFDRIGQGPTDGHILVDRPDPRQFDSSTSPRDPSLVHLESSHSRWRRRPRMARQGMLRFLAGVPPTASPSAAPVPSTASTPPPLPAAENSGDSVGIRAPPGPLSLTVPLPGPDGRAEGDVGDM
ncbi:hypothetical protein N658DRAFT_484278 [Parathielavia hyrcaniae]|uniref:Uncharacterized protein n=1 Tax=Parathielavia hyrcaniae TaxID=113614 RepID=A0AAN6T402_9PEZI|nr:hypothetical protein N658DRAFT_484278 [Parathielavia hyrcaniae]